MKNGIIGFVFGAIVTQIAVAYADDRDQYDREALRVFERIAAATEKQERAERDHVGATQDVARAIKDLATRCR